MSYSESEIERIEELLDRAYQSEDLEEIASFARQILEMDSDNPEALILLADSLDYSEEKLELLQKARGPLRQAVEEAGLLGSESLMDAEEGILYIGLLQRLGFALLSEARTEEALEVAQDIVSYDSENLTLGKTLVYRCLIDLQRFGEVLEQAMGDDEVTPARQHAVAISTFMLSGANRASYKALWDAFKVGPNIPFYILGYIPEPDPEEMSEEEEEDFNFSILFEDAWTLSRELFNWFSSATILFGLLTDRFLEEDKESFFVLLGSLNIRSYYEDALQKIGPHDRYTDAEVLDEEVLSVLRAGTFLPLD